MPPPSFVSPLGNMAAETDKKEQENERKNFPQLLSLLDLLLTTVLSQW
jgi:hypothetical protein